jgi:hypothetical protein
MQTPVQTSQRISRVPRVIDMDALMAMSGAN